MEILLWLVPSALVTMLAAWGAAVAARREEARRVDRQDQTQETPHESGQGRGPVPQVPGWDELEVGDGVSQPRPARRPLDPAPRPAHQHDHRPQERADADDRPGADGSQRRSA